MALRIESSAFKENEMIPARYTCDGANISPPLSWSDPPAETNTFALIFDDPDAPAKTWVHWVLYNIPAQIDHLEENIPTGKEFDNGSKHGINDFKNYGYGGPCPPGGTHGYRLKFYALDTDLDLGSGVTKQQLIDAMDGHILEKTELIGNYSRK